ncbi:hypothetical protein RQ479_32270 (plasmid) [Mesorhizobium sp. ISC25]
MFGYGMIVWAEYTHILPFRYKIGDPRAAMCTFDVTQDGRE